MTAGQDISPEDPKEVAVSNTVTVIQGKEPGVVISRRHYDRLIERLDGCKRGGWTDLWLAVVGAGIALAAAAGVGLAALPDDLAVTDANVLRVLTGGGLVVALLATIAYFTQRRDHGHVIDELKQDLQMYSDPGSSRRAD